MEDFHRLIAQPLKMNRPTLDSENSTFFKTHEIKYTTSTMFKRHYIDEIEYPPSPICREKPQFESNITSFQFRQNAYAFWRGLSQWVTIFAE